MGGMGADAADSVATFSIEGGSLVVGVTTIRAGHAGARNIHTLYTACPTLANSFIHNILWCWQRLDTNSRCPARHVFLVLAYPDKIFHGPENPKTNQSFCRTTCLKFDQPCGRTGPGATKRPAGPWNAVKSGLSSPPAGRPRRAKTAESLRGAAPGEVRQPLPLRESGEFWV